MVGHYQPSNILKKCVQVVHQSRAAPRRNILEFLTGSHISCFANDDMIQGNILRTLIVMLAYYLL